MHRFFITPEDTLSEKEFVIRNEDLVHQWTRVLRFAVGEEVMLLNNSGKEYLGVIERVEKKEIHGAVRGVRQGAGEPRVHITLAQSLLKNTDKIEWVLQKGTELGVSAFVPLVTSRTERKHGLKRERVERIIQEAAEQSGCARIPVLGVEETFAQVLDTKALIIVPHPDAEESFSVFKKRIGILPESVVVCIGPEGGFSPEEIGLARERGAHVVSLGSRTLRSETAGPVLAVLLSEWAGEF